MGETTEQIKELISKWFPGLQKDSDFKLTSKATAKYNCIAWAYNRDDCWMWPNTGLPDYIDGINYWPDNRILPATVNNFIEAFKIKGYEVCSGFQHEEGYIKIALYAHPGTDECTHASRELRNGFWTSKLGEREDVQHRDPTTIEGDIYGEVRVIMRRVFR